MRSSMERRLVNLSHKSLNGHPSVAVFSQITYYGMAYEEYTISKLRGE